MANQAPTEAIDEAALDALMTRALADIGATFGAALIVIGDRLGLYQALASGGPLTSTELAEQCEVTERYIREWLNAQAAAGYVTYQGGGRYTLSPEQACVLAHEDGPAFLPGAFQIANAAARDPSRLAEAFRSGAGVGWHEHAIDLFEGTERFFRAGYKENLIGSWIPALDGVEARLLEGAKVADVGCGYGASVILMAQAYPRSQFVGFDYHEHSIEEARRRAEVAGVADRARFEVASAKDYPGTNYDLVAFFDCLHDMGDPVGAARHVRQTLGLDGTWLIVEPYATDDVETNLNPTGRLYYAASTLICTPASLAQEVGAALGAQAGEARLRDVVTAGGFSRFRRAAETPFNLVLEARP